MDIPIYFYHATSAGNEAWIKADNILKPQVHNPPLEWMWLVNQHHELIPKGVWFCATLYNGNLPTMSPYGNRRVRIPIASVIQQLGGNVELYEGTVQGKGLKTYVRLMLVKAGDFFNFGILKFMTLLDIANNPWLTLTGGYKVACRPTWVEIYIPYPIDVSNCLWDQL